MSTIRRYHVLRTVSICSNVGHTLCKPSKSLLQSPKLLAASCTIESRPLSAELGLAPAPKYHHDRAHRSTPRRLPTRGPAHRRSHRRTLPWSPPTPRSPNGDPDLCRRSLGTTRTPAPPTRYPASRCGTATPSYRCYLRYRQSGGATLSCQ